jgi:hypothetical protein
MAVADQFASLHLCKLAVGVRDLDHLRALQAERLGRDPPLRHTTRNFPRRAAELLQGGSIYWVIAGAFIVRQRLCDIRAERGHDGVARACLVLDPELIAVRARPIKPFQGWRYLAMAAAPADLDTLEPSASEHTLPPALRRELRALCLL